MYMRKEMHSACLLGLKGKHNIFGEKHWKENFVYKKTHLHFHTFKFFFTAKHC